MNDEKIILLVELTLLPQYLEEVKAVLKDSLKKTLQEPGCEALYETSREGEPNKLVFFEVFASREAHQYHLEQDYTKRIFKTFEGKMASEPVITNLHSL
jgi:quinol monooxygenase YgiN